MTVALGEPPYANNLSPPFVLSLTMATDAAAMSRTDRIRERPDPKYHSAALGGSSRGCKAYTTVSDPLFKLQGTKG